MDERDKIIEACWNYRKQLKSMLDSNAENLAIYTSNICYKETNEQYFKGKATAYEDSWLAFTKILDVYICEE